MRRTYLIFIFLFFMSDAFAQNKRLKADLKTSWYAELDKCEDYNTIDTLVLRKFDDLVKYNKRYYIIYDHHKRDIFRSTFLNNIPDGINDVSSATYEKWKIKKETDELYYLTRTNFDLNSKIVFRALPFYRSSGVMDHIILVRVKR